MTSNSQSVFQARVGGEGYGWGKKAGKKVLE